MELYPNLRTLNGEKTALIKQFFFIELPLRFIRIPLEIICDSSLLQSSSYQLFDYLGNFWSAVA